MEKLELVHRLHGPVQVVIIKLDAKNNVLVSGSTEQDRVEKKLISVIRMEKS